MALSLNGGVDSMAILVSIAKAVMSSIYPEKLLLLVGL